MRKFLVFVREVIMVMTYNSNPDKDSVKKWKNKLKTGKTFNKIKVKINVSLLSVKLPYQILNNEYTVISSTFKN